MAATVKTDLAFLFRRRILLPLLLGATLVAVLAGCGLVLVTNYGDEISVERQVREARIGVGASIDELAQTQEIAAVWDASTAELRKPAPDWRWMDENVGSWLFKMFNHDQVYILDAQDRPIYATSAGKRVEASRFSSISGTLAHLIDRVRGRSVAPNNVHERLPRVPLNPASSVRTSAAAVHATDLAWINERPAAISIMRMAPHTQSLRQEPGREPLLVSIRYLDGNLLTELAERNLIAKPRFSPSLDAHAGELGFPLQSGHGHIGYFIWEPELPGSRMRGYMAAVLVALAAFLALIMGLLARSLHKAMREQIDAKSELESAMMELRASEAHAHHLAFHDVLTGLPNRSLFHDRMEQALARARKNSAMALLMLDLDRFKLVNDTLGHVAGDALIRDFAWRLKALLDESATLARLGGDEFVVLVPDIQSRERIHELCERILRVVHEPFEVLGNQAFVGVSIGVVFAPEAGVDRTELMRKADIALYRAKGEGRDCYRLFEAEMDDSVRFRTEIEDELRAALQSGNQLSVFYQPQVAAEGETIIGLEALVRWRHPTRGPIPPETFVPIAEETGLISQLGEWVLKEACGAAKRWPGLFIGVNLSPVQFRTPNFAERTVEIVREAGVAPGQFELEVTETVLLQDDEIVTKALVQLRTAGFRIALDDFGTGYSSLSHLRRFVVDKIKIDRSFVQNLGKLDSAAIVTAVVNLGHAMGLQVTAEGVETNDQSMFLAAAGCNVMQGYLFSRAIPEGELAELVTEQASRRNAA